MHSLAWLLLLIFVDDSYVNQVIATAYWAIPVIGLSALKYVRFPLIAMACYLTAQSLLLPTNAALGYFAPKEVIYWCVLFTYIYATDFDFKNPYFIPVLCLLYLFNIPVLPNRSLDLSFMVALLPFAPAWQFVPVVALMLLKGSGLASWAMMVVVVLRFGSIFSLGAVALVAVKAMLNPRLVMSKFEAGDRLDMWKAAMLYYWEHCNIWIGSGLGTFMLYGKKIQALAGYKDPSEVWFSLHNDWLQWLFETGIVGAALALLLLYSSLRRVPKAYQISLAAMGVCGLGYFPMDCPAFELLLAWLILKGQLRSH